MPRKANSWALSIKKARAKLGIKGFVAIKKGSKLYAEAKRIHGKKRGGVSTGGRVKRKRGSGLKTGGGMPTGGRMRADKNFRPTY